MKNDFLRTGGPAFPVLYGQTNGLDGMTLRDWFAGQALAGVSAELMRMASEDGIGKEHIQQELQIASVGLAGMAYALANAMIAVRGK